MSSAAGEQRILIVDDEEANLGVLDRLLRQAGFERIAVTSDPRQTLPLFLTFRPDLLLLDLHMPHLDGFEVLRQIRPRVPPGQFFPVLVLTGDLGLDSKQRALAGGASDFLLKPFDRIEVLLRVRNLLKTRELTQDLERQVQERTDELRATELVVADRLALAAELRDYRGGAHTRRVGRLAAELAQQLGLEAELVEMIRRAAPLHDIGKLGVPDRLLLKPSRLTGDEMGLLRTHTTIGGRLLSGSRYPVLQIAEEIALYHHENWDGTGYTPGLAGEAIPLASRITAVADVFDALVHERPYKGAWPVTEAVTWIERQRGRKFDPDVVDAFRDTASRADFPFGEDDDVLGLVGALADHQDGWNEGRVQ